MSEPTIYARASGGGRAGVAVHRISGPLCNDVIEKLLRRKELKPRVATRTLVRGADGTPIDDGLALFFPGPNSFTGDDVLELHLHGSVAVELRLNEELDALGLQPAGPGAFTLKAFGAGKMDLTQVEGLADLLEAETAHQHKQALGQMRGALRERAEGWRRSLISIMASLDAAVDFPDEEDVGDTVASAASPIVRELWQEIDQILGQAPRARQVAKGIKVALIGPPNAGKSSLFNAILQDNRAIVSDEAGTTRDIVSAVVDIGGHRVELLDTAGLRETSESVVEQEGIRRARQMAEEADVRILLFPVTDGELPSWMTALQQEGDIVLRSKADLRDGAGFSVKSDADIETLVRRLRQRFDMMAAPGLTATARQVTSLRQFADALKGADDDSLPPELRSEQVRRAATAIETLTGRIATDDVLGDIFSSFCIGK